MGNIIAIIKVIISIIPILGELITAAEALFPAQGSGVQKLELVKTLLQNTYTSAQEMEAPFAAVWPVLSSLITYIVPIFTGKTPAVQATTAAAQVTPIPAPTNPAVAAAVAAQTSQGVQLAAPNA